MLQIPNKFGQAITGEINLYLFIESWLKYEYTPLKSNRMFVGIVAHHQQNWAYILLIYIILFVSISLSSLFIIYFH